MFLLQLHPSASLARSRYRGFLTDSVEELLAILDGLKPGSRAGAVLHLALDGDVEQIREIWCADGGDEGGDALPRYAYVNCRAELVPLSGDWQGTENTHCAAVFA